MTTRSPRGWALLGAIILIALPLHPAWSQITRITLTEQSSAGNFGTGAFTTSSFTPANNSLLVVVAAQAALTDSGAEGTDLTITDSRGLTWTSRAATSGVAAQADWSYGARIWTAPVTTGQSMTVSVDCGAFNIDLYDVAVYQVTGYDTNNPIGSTASGFVLGGDGPATITLSAASASSSYLLASAVGASGSHSPYSAAAGSGWTELRDVYPGEGYLLQHIQERTGYAGAAVSWADLNDGAAPPPNSRALLAVEIKAASGGGGGGGGALTRATLREESSPGNFGTGAFTPGLFTPANNSLLVVVAAQAALTDSGAEGTNLTIVDSVGLTWTSRAATSGVAALADWSYGARIWTAPVTAGQSMAISIDCGAFNIDLYDVAVYQFTGYDTNNPIGSTASGFVLGGDGPATITLSAASASSSYLLASAVGASGSHSPYSAAAGSGWTELRDVYPGEGYLLQHIEGRTGYAGTAVSWADLNDGAAPPPNSRALIAVEIRASQTGGDTGVPAAPNPVLVSRSAPTNGVITVTGQAGAVAPNATVRLRNVVTGASVTLTASANGSFSAAIGGSAGNLLQVWVQNAAGTAGQAISLGPGQTNFEYDVLGRLHKVTDADTSSVIYNYDPAGNRQTVTATKN